MMQTSQRGRQDLLKSEQFRAYAYPDPLSPLAKATPRKPWGFKPAAAILATLSPAQRKLDASPWTCGVGQTRGVNLNTEMSLAQGMADLNNSLPRYEALVRHACARPPTQAQFDALVALAWNCEAALKPNSSIIKAHNRGDIHAAAKAFELYSKSRGVDNAALLARRKREAARYLELGDGQDGNATDKPAHDDDANPPTLGLVADPEKPLTKSKINMASATAATVASVSAVTESLRAVGELRDGIASLGTWLLPLALVAIVGLCAYVMWQRYTLRRRGLV